MCLSCGEHANFPHLAMHQLCQEGLIMGLNHPMKHWRTVHWPHGQVRIDLKTHVFLCLLKLLLNMTTSLMILVMFYDDQGCFIYVADTRTHLPNIQNPQLFLDFCLPVCAWFAWFVTLFYYYYCAGV